MRPCACDRTRPGSYTADQCRLCWLYHFDPGYRQLWDREASASAVGHVSDVPSAHGHVENVLHNCRHLGEATGATVPCSTCRRTVLLKLFACAVHGRCTQARQVPDVACCVDCPDRDPSSGG
jgi:hypothetical protein